MKAILLMGYGAPKSMDDLAAYYASIHHRKEVEQSVVTEAQAQFYQHGVGETLGSIVKRQTVALAHILKHVYNLDIPIYAAFKHTPPSAATVVNKMVEAGVKEIYLFTMKPIVTERETLLNKKIVEKALDRLEARNISVSVINPGHLHGNWAGILSSRVHTAYSWLPAELRGETEVIFTAHSMAGQAAQRTAYDVLLRELAEAVAERASIEHFSTAYRSAGKNRDMWSGPDVREVIREKAAAGYKAIVISDLQSLTENIETAFDIGYDLQALCRELDLKLMRAAQPNDSFDFMMAVAEMIAARFQICG